MAEMLEKNLTGDGQEPEFVKAVRESVNKRLDGYKHGKYQFSRMHANVHSKGESIGENGTDGVHVFVTYY